jgi:hypothetical protein
MDEATRPAGARDSSACREGEGGRLSCGWWCADGLAAHKGLQDAHRLATMPADEGW